MSELEWYEGKVNSSICASTSASYSYRIRSSYHRFNYAINHINIIGNFNTFGLAIGAGLSIGLASLGAGISISAAGSAAISALAEKPDTFFRSFLIVALAEALAIYGLIMGILLWIKI